MIIFMTCLLLAGWVLFLFLHWRQKKEGQQHHDEFRQGCDHYEQHIQPLVEQVRAMFDEVNKRDAQHLSAMECHQYILRLDGQMEAVKRVFDVLEKEHPSYFNVMKGPYTQLLRTASMVSNTLRLRRTSRLLKERQ